MLLRKSKNAAPSQLEKNMPSKPMKPGTIAPRSGQYEQIGVRGGRTGAERTVTRGEPLPPTAKPGMGYILVDPTRNGAGRRR